ncbi:MAG: hypothetical protein LQ351_007412 [Letrouitia transgressa]|nr:MAG: hypothetical protein LQ351_007412 [Letrouitia transgressa]
MSSIDSGGTSSWQAAFSQAAGKADETKIRQLLAECGPGSNCVKETLRIALQKVAGRGNVSLCRLLLEEGAEVNNVPDNEVPPLWRAADAGKEKVVKVLLEYGAYTEALDKSGRTAIFPAALKGHWNTLNVLLQGGANANVRDVNDQSLVLCLTSDKSERRIDKIEEQLKEVEEKLREFRDRLDKKEKQSDKKRRLEKEKKELQQGKKELEARNEVIRILLGTDIDLEAKDKDGRTALLWAAALGKDTFAKLLLTCRTHKNADIHATNNRGKTALHLGAENNHLNIVKLLMDHGAEPHARSDGGWTALHNAADKGHCEVASFLLNRNADVNAMTSSGMTALHWSARNGHADMVELLLQQNGVKKNGKDSFDSTPMLGAAEKGHIEIVQMLSPSHDRGLLSDIAVGACKGFQATVVDFGMENRSLHHSKCSVFDILYGQDEKGQKPLVTTLVKNIPAKPIFRWIHLPANNMTWVDTLITKYFIENGASDVDGFKTLEKSFGQCHKGPRTHSHFMRPLCQRMAPTEKSPPGSDLSESAAETFVDTASTIAASSTFTRETSAEQSTPERKPKRGVKKGSKVEKPSIGATNGTAPRKAGISRIDSMASYSNQSEQSWIPRKTPFRKPERQGNIVLFMPYLHYETDERRRHMSKAIKQAETTARDRPQNPIVSCSDEMLVEAYLRSTHNLHVRRTLDQFYYHAIETDERDVDQVVYRYTRDKQKELKVFMVDQLWLWILGKELIISSFPQRWRQPKHDPLNVLDGVIEDMSSKTQPPVKSVYDLATLITGRCCGVFDRHRLGDEDYQFIDMFESSIGEVTNKETKLFKVFNDASELAAQWLRFQRQQGKSQIPDMRCGEDDPEKDPAFVDILLDIGKETALLAETKDIRDELNMISMVLKNQLSVIDDLTNALLQETKGNHNQRRQAEIRQRFREQQKLIEVHLKDVERMDKQAEGIYTSPQLTHLLDLKQKHANAFEARFARDQAAFTGRQGQTIMVFTIVTAVFLPMSFIAGVFAIPIREFPHNDSGNPVLDLGYVLKFMVGIGLAISVPLIAVAFAVDNIGLLIKRSLRRLTAWMGKSQQKQIGRIEQGTSSSDESDIDRVESSNQVDISNLGRSSYKGGLSPTKHDIHLPGSGWEDSGLRRIRMSRDLERADSV